MALADILNLSKDREKIGISEERIQAILPQARLAIAYWREYPDMFVDFMAGKWRAEPVKETLNLFFYQRVFLRIAMRYKYVYAVYPRASTRFMAPRIFL